MPAGDGLTILGYLLDGDDELAASVTVLHPADGGGGLAQRVRPVDCRCDLAGLGQLSQGDQVPAVL